jgi:RNA polymerase sigma-70 factor (ECF subfamily)
MDPASSRQATDVTAAPTASDADAARVPPPTAAPQPAAELRALFQAELAYVITSLGRLGVDARDREDLAAEVFFRVSQRLGDRDRTRSVRPWLFAFAARVAAEHRRRASTRNELLGAAEDASGVAVEPRATASGDRELVELGLAALDFDRRAVFVMHFLDEMTVPEIARALDIPLGTAYTRLRSARELFTAAVRRIRKAER